MESGSIVGQQDDSRELRARIHGMWAAVAPGWADHADHIDARGAHMTEAILDEANPAPGERVLELACGPGGLGLAAAERVSPGGHVVMSDVAAEMTAIAAARAAARGIENVSTRELDLEGIDEADASYDIVLCREGLMFATEPGRAASELHRVLRSDGRAVITVWGPRERNPWLGLVFDAVSDQIGAPIPPPGIPGPFSLADAGELRRLLTAAGLVDVDVRELPVPLRAGSFDEWWTRTSALAGPLAKVLASLPSETTDAIQARLREAIASYETTDGIELPGLSLLASGRRP